MAKKVYIDFELKYKEAVKNLDEMQKEYTKLEKKVDKYDKQVEKAAQSQNEMGNVLDKVTGGAVTKFKALQTSLGGVAKAFTKAKVAAGFIGLLVVAVSSLIAMFKNSEAGQNKFAKLMTKIGVITGNVMDIVSDFGKVMFNVFTGNFKAAGEALNEVTEGIKNFGEETAKELKVAGELADKRAKADILERDLIVERAEATRKYNSLREKAADKENFSAQERINFLVKAGKIEEEITLKEIEAARLRFEAKSAENKLSQSTKEDLDEEAQLKARLIELEAGRLKKQKTLNAELTTNRREAKAEEIADEKALADLKKNIRDAEAVSEEDKRALELQKIDEHYQELINKAVENNLETTELEDAQRQAKIDKQNEFDTQDLERAKKLAADKKVIRDKELADEKAVEDAKLQIHNAAAGALMTGFRLLASTDKKNKKLQAAMLIATNAVGIASNIINTNAANARLTLEGGIAAPALILANKIRMFTGIAASVAATAQGLAALKEGGNPNSVTPRDSGGGNLASQSPAFNVVGASATNQLASVIGEQERQPVQAFVVSNDITTAQELDRNIIEGATIG
tara:strand:- start:658 stop:2376 length:1719 start_codon:yes stop_codon:yes gene_type:complete